MTPRVYRWVAGVVAREGLAEKATLEVGSLDVNGSVRDLFRGSYIGVDFRPGPGVDEVMSADSLRYNDRAFHTVVTTEMLEHDRRFWKSLQEMGRVLRPGGHLILTTRSNGFKEHGHPFDYWRFMPDSAAMLMDLAGCEMVESHVEIRERGLYVYGRKP